MNEGDSALRTSLAERAAEHERTIVIAALVLVALTGYLATLRLGDRLMLPEAPSAGNLAYAFLLFAMWWTMMMAMMLPTAAPAILIYGAMRRKFLAKGMAQPPYAVFIMGYVTIWTGFSLAAVVLQIMTRDVIPLTGMMAVTSHLIGGVLLTAAGLYQLTPFKTSCLRKCQSPFMFFVRNWKNGAAGAFHVGLDHGLYCLGCCWVLMALLFYGGVMELTWIIGLALYVLAEKLIPLRFHLRHITGLMLAAWGIWLIISSI